MIIAAIIRDISTIDRFYLLEIPYTKKSVGTVDLPFQ
jgi:hypothetical protein